MNQTPPPDPALNLRFLRLLVTVLTGTMIAGLAAVIWLLVIRLPAALPPPPAPTALALPASITLPDGASATAFTVGPDWIAVITRGRDILIYDATTGALRQTLHIEH